MRESASKCCIVKNAKNFGIPQPGKKTYGNTADLWKQFFMNSPIIFLELENC